jgi:ADP-ribosylglycohydrolase
MLGAIAGDIIGSVFEARPIKTTKFPLFHPRCRFTDDTVLTVALADSLMHGSPFVGLLKQYYRAYPNAGYGGSFHQWAQSEDSSPYQSWRNGSAMRVSQVGFACATLNEVLSGVHGGIRLQLTMLPRHESIYPMGTPTLR